MHCLHKVYKTFRYTKVWAHYSNQLTALTAVCVRFIAANLSLLFSVTKLFDVKCFVLDRKIDTSILLFFFLLIYMYLI